MKRIIAILLALTLCVATASVSVFAEESTPEEEFAVIEESTSDEASGPENLSEEASEPEIIFEEESGIEIPDFNVEEEATDAADAALISGATGTLSSVTLKYSSKKYTGKSITQTGTTVVKAVVNGSIRTLKNGTDYTISYKNNVNVGTATMIVKGKGNYTGTIRKTFKITPVKLGSVKMKYSYKNYTGTARTQTDTTVVKAKVGGKTKTLKKGTDYTISYQNNKEVGKASMIVKGKGNYTGTIKKTFYIYPKITEEKVYVESGPIYRYKITAKGSKTIWTKQTKACCYEDRRSPNGVLGYNRKGLYYYFDMEDLTNGTVYAVDILTGKLKWKVTSKNLSCGALSGCFDSSGNIYVVDCGISGLFSRLSHPILKINTSGKIVKSYTWTNNNKYSADYQGTTLTFKSGKLKMNAVKGLQFDQYGYPKNTGTNVTLKIDPSTGKITEA